MTNKKHTSSLIECFHCFDSSLSVTASLALAGQRILAVSAVKAEFHPGQVGILTQEEKNNHLVSQLS